MRDDEYREFLRYEGKCVACRAILDSIRAGGTIGFDKSGKLPDLRPGTDRGYCDPCHTENNGMRSKGPDSGCAPLCRVHHDEYDGRARLSNSSWGKLAFEAYYGVDMKAEAVIHFHAFLIWKEHACLSG